MKCLNASEFEDQCLSLPDHLNPEGTLSTKHGKPAAGLIPIESGGAELIGSMKDKIKPTGRITFTGVKWNAIRRMN